ncbi:hypothetical protein H6G27_29635 [Nostoc linckia FACHB-104]|nr:hypothetical protein [Nostoc linckia FACHB-104]
MTIKSLEQAMTLWGQTKNVINTRLLSLLKIALKIHILPNLGYQETSQFSAKKFSDFCNQISIFELEYDKVILIFNQAFEVRIQAGELSARTKENYRAAINKFFNWLQTEDWYIKQSESFQLKIHPKRVYAHRQPAITYDGKRLYRIYEKDLTPEILLDLESYENFWNQDSHTADFTKLYSEQTTKNQVDRRIQRLKQAEEEARQGNYYLKPVFSKVSKSTLNQRKDQIFRFFGWCVNIEGYDINDLSLDLITRKTFLKPYIAWLIKDRACGSGIGRRVLEVGISVAKYRTFKNSRTVDWSDISLVEFLRSQRNLFTEQDKKEQPQIQKEKWDKKELSHQQAQEVVKYLYETTCQEKRIYFRGNGEKIIDKRKPSELFDDWQTYLMIKILVYAPIRQEELAKLRIGKTLILVKDSQGVERYAVKIKEHKNTNKTGKIRYYPLPKILTKDITTWINKIRSLAIKAPETINTWLAFWGYSKQTIANLEKKIQETEAEQNPDEKYLKYARQTLRGMKNRTDAWAIAKQNAEKCDHLFFVLGRSHPKRFACSYEVVKSCITPRITTAMGNATLALFGEAKFLSPHGFRHIGAKHLRTIGNDGYKEAFSALVGHTVKIDDNYAETITEDYDLIKCVVDNWWE